MGWGGVEEMGNKGKKKIKMKGEKEREPKINKRWEDN